MAIDLYEEGGYVVLKSSPRGRESGEGRTLAAEQVDITVKEMQFWAKHLPPREYEVLIEKQLQSS